MHAYPEVVLLAETGRGELPVAPLMKPGEFTSGMTIHVELGELRAASRHLYVSSTANNNNNNNNNNK